MKPMYIMSNCLGIFLNSVRKFFALLIKANYHEYIILDKNGKSVGYEFYTTRGSKVIRVEEDQNLTDHDDPSEID